MDTLKRHLNYHTDETYKCPMCTYITHQEWMQLEDTYQDARQT